MDFISLYTLLLLNSFIQTSKGASLSSSSASSILTVSPSRSQFFFYELISFYCETPRGDSTGWTVMRNANGKAGKCHNEWGRPESSCKLSGAYLSDSGVYWCESQERRRINTVNITVTDGDVILDSPVLPVLEGSDVTLRCWYRNKKHPKPSSNLPADFYKDGSLISNTSTENMTIHNVNTSDGGFYKCIISGRRESPESWMDVRENEFSVTTPPNESAHSSTDPAPLIYILIGTAVSFLFVFLLVLASMLCYRKHKVSGITVDPAPQGVIYAEVTLKTKKKRGTPSPGADSAHVIQSVSGTTDDPAPQGVIYAEVTLKKKKKRERPSPGADSAHVIQSVAGGVVTGRADTVYSLAGHYTGPHTDPVYSLAGC